MRTLLAALVLPLTLAACGSSTALTDAASTPAKVSESPKPKPKATPSPDKDCRAVSSEMLAGIASGAVDSISPSKGAAVRSEDHKELYYIAVRFGAEGIGNDNVGVWASNSLEPGGGLIVSVDGMAKQFTSWPDGSKTGAETSSSDDGAEDAKDCL